MHVIVDLHTGKELLRADSREQLLKKANEIELSGQSDVDLYGFTYWEQLVLILIKSLKAAVGIAKVEVE